MTHDTSSLIQPSCAGLECLPKLGEKMRFIHVMDVKSGSLENSPCDWRKSSLSLANGDCVEVAAPAGGFIRVRDSKNPKGPVLGFGRAQWNSFVNGIHDGAFDREQRLEQKHPTTPSLGRSGYLAVDHGSEPI